MLLDNSYTHDNRVKREAEALVKAGYQVVLFALENQDLPVYEASQGVQVYRIIQTHYFYYHSLKDWQHFKNLTDKILKRVPNVDYIHVHDATLLAYGFFLKLRTGGSLIYDAHEYWYAWTNYKLRKFKDPYSQTGSEQSRQYNIRHWQIIQKVERWLLPHCDAVISVSQSICNILANKRKQAGNSCVLIRNTPYYTHLVAASENQKAFHRHFQLPEETIVLLYQGGIEPTRGIEKIVKALDQVMDLPLCLVAMGPVQDHRYLEILKCHAPAGRFFYKEGVYSNEYLQWTASADIGVVATLNIHDSYYYSMPNKLFEYIQAEIPVLNTNFPDSSKLVAEYEVGLNFDIESTQSIAAAIRKMVTDQALYQQCKANTRQAKQALCWEKEQQKLLMLYQRLRASRGNPTGFRQHA